MSLSEGADGQAPASTPMDVLLVDDHEMVRHGLRLLIESVLGHRVREAGGGLDALELIEAAAPDVVLLDARMPDRDGIWTLQRIGAQHPTVPVIMLSTYDEAEYVDAAIENGACGYLLKDASADQLGEAISTALDGRGLYLHPQVAQRLLVRRGDLAGTLPLSSREKEILAQVAAGLSNRAIGLELHMAEKTVKSHLTSIFRKLGVGNRTQAVTTAIQAGLLRSPQPGPDSGSAPD